MLIIKGVSGITRRCAGQLLKSPGHDFLIRPENNYCYSLLSTSLRRPLCCAGVTFNYVHVKKENNFTQNTHQITTTRSSSSLPPPSFGDVIIVRKAKKFTRSLAKNSMDGIVSNVSDENEEGDEHVVINFGEYLWHCRRPPRNRSLYVIGDHVRVTRLMESDSPTRGPILVIQSEMPLEKHKWTTSFPWRLTPAEKTIFYYFQILTVFVILTPVAIVFAMLVSFLWHVTEGIQWPFSWPFSWPRNK